MPRDMVETPAPSDVAAGIFHHVLDHGMPVDRIGLGSGQRGIDAGKFAG